MSAGFRVSPSAVIALFELKRFGIGLVLLRNGVLTTSSGRAFPIVSHLVVIAGVVRAGPGIAPPSPPHFCHFNHCLEDETAASICPFFWLKESRAFSHCLLVSNLGYKKRLLIWKS